MNKVIEPLVGSKMAITLELKLCESIFSRGIEKQKGYQSSKILAESDKVFKSS